MRMTDEAKVTEATHHASSRPIESEHSPVTPSQPHTEVGVMQCKSTSGGDVATRQSEAFWRQMFEEIGVRKKPAPPPPKTWKDRLACAGVVCLVALLASQLGYRCYMDYHYGFEAIDTSDPQLLKEIMFGGKPWIVLCRWPHKRMKIPDAVDRSRVELVKVMRLGKLDCAATLPSGVTFAERFRIPSTTEGLILANGKAPRLLTPWALETKKNLLSYVERHTKLEIRTVDDNGSLARRCLLPAGGRCIVMLRHGGIPTSEQNKKLQRIFGDDSAVRKLKFAVVDTQKRQLSLHGAAELLPVSDPMETQVVCFVNTTPRAVVEELMVVKKKDDATRHSFKVRVYEGTFSDTRALIEFAKDCARAGEGTEGYVAMTKSPTVSRT